MARVALAAYVNAVSTRESTIALYEQNNGDGSTVCDLIGDLLHYCDDAVLDIDEIWHNADLQYGDEVVAADDQKWKWPK